MKCLAMDSKTWLENIYSKARQSISKPSPYGSDIDISSYISESLENVLFEPKLDVRRVEEVGVNLSANALYLQVDQTYFKYISRIPGVEVLRIEDFIESNPDEAKEYVWKLIDPGADKYTALAALRGRGGYFVRVKRNTRVEEPIMACLFISYGGLQAPHNIVIVEDGAEATVYTGCTIAPEILGLHIGISEFYVGENAKLRFVMVHSWNRVAHVRPRTSVVVGDGGEYISYYVNISNVKTLQMFPTIYLGYNAHTYSASILLGQGDSEIDIGTKAYLVEESGAELISRAIAKDNSRVIMRASIIGRGGRGHIDCRGLMQSNTANIRTIPELQAESPNVVLTHEASIGRLAEEEIYYLMSKGFSENEAIGILVRGFISVDTSRLPERIRTYINTIEKLTAERAM